MALIALVSAKGSPGVSTAALAFALSWNSPTIVAECDPAGGGILAGVAGRLSLPADHGLLRLAMADSRHGLTDEFWSQLVDLGEPGRQRLLLPGIASPRQAATLAVTWPRLAALFAGLGRNDNGGRPNWNLLADCGRLAAPHAPWPVLARADLVLLVLRPISLRTIAPAWPALGELREALAAPDAPSLGLLLIGGGQYGRREVEQHLGCPVVATLPYEPRAAAALAGAEPSRSRRTLLRAAAAAQAPICSAAAARPKVDVETNVDTGLVRHAR